MSQQSRVTVSTPIQLEVGLWLRQHGFELTDIHNMDLGPLRRMSYGILYEPEPNFDRFHARRLLGKIFFDRDVPGGWWKIRVYGEDRMKKAEEIADGLEAKFRTSVDVILDSYEPVYENII